MKFILLLLKYTLFLEPQKRKADELPHGQPSKKKSGVKQPVARFTNLEEAKRRKQSIIPIRNVEDGLCCASAIIMALERYGCYDLKEEPNNYKQYLNANRASRPSSIAKFTKAARYLHEIAGTSNNIICSLSHLALPHIYYAALQVISEKTIFICS